MVTLSWQLAAYLMSFVVFGILWVNHRQLAAALDSAPRGFQWLTLHLMFWMTLIPAATAYLADHPTSPVALAIYAGVLGAISLAFGLLRLVLSKFGPDNALLGRINFAMTYRSLAASLIYGAAIPLAFITPFAAMACLVAVPLMFCAPASTALEPA